MIRKNSLSTFLLISCVLVFSQANAQDTAQRRGVELLLAFQSLDHQAGRGELTGSTGRERAQIKEAVTSVAWKLASIEVMESGCDYYYSTEPEDLDAAKLAAFLADSDRAFFASRVDFFEEKFKRLSPNTKAKFNENANTDLIFDRSTQTEDDGFLHYFQLEPEFIIERFGVICESLSERRRRIESGEVSAVSEVIITTGGQEDDN